MKAFWNSIVGGWLALPPTQRFWKDNRRKIYVKLLELKSLNFAVSFVPKIGYSIFWIRFRKFLAAEASPSHSS